MLTVFLTPFLRYNGVSLHAPESLLTYLFLTIIGLLIALLMIWGGNLAQVLSGSFFIILFAFYQTDDLPKLPFGLRYISIGLPSVALLSFALYSLRKNLEQFLFIVFGVLWLGAFFQVTPPASKIIHQETDLQADTSLPPYIHIILDEHVGIEGIPNYADQGEKFRTELKNKYIDQGFRVFGRAYSRYFRTKDSTTSFLNFKPNSEPYKSRFVNGMIRPNGLFDKLTEQGYIINIFQTSTVPYCDKEGGYKLGKCISYRIDMIHTANGPVTILSGLLAKMKLLNRFNEITKAFALPELVIPGSAPFTTVGAFNKNIDFLSEGKKGNAYFIHLLLPHFHWFFDEQCSYRIKEWEFLKRNETSNIKSSPLWFRKDSISAGENYSSDQIGAYRGYLKQVKCTHKVLDNFLEKINSNPETKDSTIIIHGDHGSRITPFYPFIESADQLTNEDYIQSYSTFFTVRSPNHTNEYDRRPLALDELMKTIILGIEPLSETDEQKFVYLTDPERQMYKEYPLPPFANGHPTNAW